MVQLPKSATNKIHGNPFTCQLSTLRISPYTYHGDTKAWNIYVINHKASPKQNPGTHSKLCSQHSVKRPLF